MTDNTEQAIKEMRKFIETKVDKVRRNTHIVIPTKEQRYALHISENPNIKQFEPIIGLRQAESEDRTVPRVCVAQTLVGCMIAHNGITNSFNKLDPVPKKDAYFKYLGGFYIYAIPYLVALAPNNKLVYDASKTGERWLVSYNKETVKYPSNKVGKFFIKSITASYQNNKKVSIAKIYLKTTVPMFLTADHRITEGCYILEGPVPEALEGYDGKPYSIQKISESDFDRMNALSVSLLSHNTPPGILSLKPNQPSSKKDQ